MSLRLNSAFLKDWDVLLPSSNRLNMQPAVWFCPCSQRNNSCIPNAPRFKPRRHRHDHNTGWSPNDRKKEFPMITHAMITNALTVAQKLLVAGRKEVLAVGLMVLYTLGIPHPANAQEVTYIIFDAPGSTFTQPTSINAKGA